MSECKQIADRFVLKTLGQHLTKVFACWFFDRNFKIHQMLTYAARSVKFGGARTYLCIKYIIATPQSEDLHNNVVVLRKYESIAKVRCWANSIM